MGTVSRYFREHPWQRRAVTSSATLLIGLMTAILLYPHLMDYWLVHRLGDARASVRERAILQAIAAAENSQRTRNRLSNALDTESDTRFVAIATVLNSLNRFYTPDRDPLHVSRMRTIKIETTHSPIDPGSAATTRWTILGEVIRARRDNRYVRRALDAAARDPAAIVRTRAALLAARFGDDNILADLLKDPDAGVQAAAALAAGIARRAELAGPLRGLLDSTEDREAVSAAAYALARLAPAESGAVLAKLLDRTGDAKLRERLIHVLGVMGGDDARRIVGKLFARARQAGGFPSTAALLSAGRLKLRRADGGVKAVLAAATKKGTPLAESQVLAALSAADALNLPVRKEAHDICLKLWNPALELTMIAAADLLGRQADAPQPGVTDTPSRKTCLATLRKAAVYEVEPTTRPAGASAKIFTTPLASAAAAVALWRLETTAPLAEQYVRNAAAAHSTLPGDHVAWHVAQEPGEQAFNLGLRMLPASDAPAHLHVYNDNERAAGAMLLALAARTDEQRGTAAERIASRLAGKDLGGEDDPYVIGAYQCALLMLGRDDLRDKVHQLLELGEFPQRRVITALCVAGDLDVLDWLALSPWISDKDVAFLLVNKGIGEVLAATVGALPTVDPAAEEDLRHWQTRILRASCVILRDELRGAARR